MTTPDMHDPVADGPAAGAASAPDLLAEVDAWLADVDLPPLSPLAAPRARTMCTAASRGASPTRPTLPLAKPKNSTQRRKQELQYLRAAVPELEARLRSLKRAAPHPQKTSGDSVWKRNAKRQRVERAAAEKERQRLLALLRDHTALLRGVESLLDNRQAWDPLHASKKKAAAAVQGSEADAWRYESLLRAIDTRYPMLETVFRSSDLGGVEPRRGYIKLLHGRPDAICMETRHSTRLPFDYRVTAETLWQSIRQGQLNYFEDVMVIEEEAHQVLTKMTIVEPPVVNRPTAVHQVFKQYAAGNSTHIMWEMAVHTSGSSGYPSLQVNVQGWGRLRPAKVSDEQPGSELEEFVQLTLRGSEQEADASDSQSPRRSTSSLSGLIVSVYQQRHDIAHQKMENLLLDATVRSAPQEWHGVGC